MSAAAPLEATVAEVLGRDGQALAAAAADGAPARRVRLAVPPRPDTQGARDHGLAPIPAKGRPCNGRHGRLGRLARSAHGPRPVARRAHSWARRRRARRRGRRGRLDKGGPAGAPAKAAQAHPQADKQGGAAPCVAIGHIGHGDARRGRGARASRPAWPRPADSRARRVEKVSRAPDLAVVLGSLGLDGDVRRLAGRRARSGRPALRGRPKKAGKSVLFVVAGGGGSGRGGEEDRPAPPPPPLSRAAGSIPGVDVVRAADLSVLDLAPGSEPGRLVVYTPGALGELEETISRSLAGRVRARRRRPARAARRAAPAPAPASAAEPAGQDGASAGPGAEAGSGGGGGRPEGGSA